MRLSKRRPAYSFETNSDFLGGIIIGVAITMLFCVICMFLYYLSYRNDKEKDNEKNEKNEKNKKVKENFENFDIESHNREVDRLHSDNSNSDNSNSDNNSDNNNYEYYTPSTQVHDFSRIADDYFNRYILRE